MGMNNGVIAISLWNIANEVYSWSVSDITTNTECNAGTIELITLSWICQNGNPQSLSFSSSIKESTAGL